MIRSSRPISFPSLAFAALLGGSTLLLNGCALSPLAKRTADFSTAATTALVQTTSAYELADRVSFDANAATLVLNFDTERFQQDKVASFIKPEDLAVRVKVLECLKHYAELLAEVAGDKPINELESKAKAVNTSAEALEATDLHVLTISDTERQGAVTALALLGGILIEHQRARALPGILAKADPAIQTICAVLVKDIGTQSTKGLVSQVHASYSVMIDDRLQYVSKNGKEMGPIVRRTEIEALPKMVLQQRASEDALKATSDALVELAAAHAALTKTANAKQSPAFRTALSELVQDGEKVGDLYSSLAKSN